MPLPSVPITRHGGHAAVVLAERSCINLCVKTGTRTLTFIYPIDCVALDENHDDQEEWLKTKLIFRMFQDALNENVPGYEHWKWLDKLQGGNIDDLIWQRRGADGQWIDDENRNVAVARPFNMFLQVPQRAGRFVRIQDSINGTNVPETVGKYLTIAGINGRANVQGSSRHDLGDVRLSKYDNNMQTITDHTGDRFVLKLN